MIGLKLGWRTLLCTVLWILGTVVSGVGLAADAGKDAADFKVVSVTKDKSHPQHGQGHKIGFLVNGMPAPVLVLVRGKTYTFEVDTGVQHDFYLTTDPAGWGVDPVVEGVEGNFIYKGTLTFKPGAQTPDVVYYQCRNHKFMGNKIHIVNPGEEGKFKQGQ